MKYRKKPVEIEAYQVSNKDIIDSPTWVMDAVDRGVVSLNDSFYTIKTLEGTMSGRYGSWLIRGVKGELYSCTDEIFQQTYDEVP